MIIIGIYARICFSWNLLPHYHRRWKRLYLKVFQCGGRCVVGGSKWLLDTVNGHRFVVKDYRFHFFSLRENDVFPQGKRCILSEKTMYSHRENDEKPQRKRWKALIDSCNALKSAVIYHLPHIYHRTVLPYYKGTSKDGGSVVDKMTILLANDHPSVEMYDLQVLL